jgi:hypothetical protein
MDQCGSTRQQGAAIDGAIIRIPSCPQGPADGKLRAEGSGRAARYDVAGRQGEVLRTANSTARSCATSPGTSVSPSTRAICTNGRHTAACRDGPRRLPGAHSWDNSTRTFRKRKKIGNHYFDSKAFTGLRRALSGFSDAVFKTPATFIWSIRPRAVSRLT